MSSGSVRALGVGDPAPDFELPDADGRPRRFSDLCTQDGRRRAAVVFFYPGDFTPVCTREACSFRDLNAEFDGVDAVVIGISPDSPETHARFRAAMRIPYILLSDQAGTARRYFGVPRTFGLLPGRVTYVIDAGGIIRMVFNSPLRAAAHARKAAEAVASLAADHQSTER